MFFKNKNTGLVWEVVHPDHIKRCKNDPNYELVESKDQQDKKPQRTTQKRTQK
jgi:hypothetical protein